MGTSIDKKLPRGYRNNNFGNLRRSKDNWQGLAPEQTDPQFFQFTAPEWGYRALIKTLQTYRKKHNLQTIAELISRWAPANENNTSAYIRSVCREMQMPSTYVPTFAAGTMCIWTRWANHPSRREHRKGYLL